jgi:alkanesulfonate monooxygenase SsuD/methylene tetrahydromethanopterin reductase-like flavin-dependent oxidoreductase (luciferase family)
LPNLGIYIDFRNPLRWQQDNADLYAENIELIRRAEQLGFGYCWLSEHHFSPDGYAPSPLVLAAAIAHATTSIRIGTAVAVLPLYNPIRLAEDSALVDILSAGRFELGVGTGWREPEFLAYDVPLLERGRRTDAGLEALVRLWSGENLEVTLASGAVERLSLTPRPVQRPRPRLWIGGASRAMLRRAARYADGIVVSNATATMADQYREELVAAGRDPASGLIANNLRWFMVSHDPPSTFETIAPYVIEWYNHYARWGGPFVPVASSAQLREAGLLTVLTPSDAVAELRAVTAVVPVHCLSIKLRPPGLPYAAAAAHLELFGAEVLPRLR